MNLYTFTLGNMITYLLGLAPAMVFNPLLNKNVIPVCSLKFSTDILKNILNNERIVPLYNKAYILNEVGRRSANSPRLFSCIVNIVKTLF